MKRNIIIIDKEKCNGCGLCIPNCPEGALQIIDGKAHLISDLFCDGLGACIGTCPEGAITIEEREAEPYNERMVMKNVVAGGPNVIKAHLKHLKDHGQQVFYDQAITYLAEQNIAVPTDMEGNRGKSPHIGGCPGMKIRFETNKPGAGPETQTKEHHGSKENATDTTQRLSALRQWPVQLHLLNPRAPYFANADLLIAADCVAFTLNGFHEQYLEGKTVVIFCPKLDNSYQQYVEKLTAILTENTVKSITVVRMEVPCCGGTRAIVDAALQKTGKTIPLKEVIVSLAGEIVT